MHAGVFSSTHHPVTADEKLSAAWDEVALLLCDGRWEWYEERIAVKGWAEASGYRTLALAAMRAYADGYRDLAESERKVHRLQEQIRNLMGMKDRVVR